MKYYRNHLSTAGRIAYDALYKAIQNREYLLIIRRSYVSEEELSFRKNDYRAWLIRAGDDTNINTVVADLSDSEIERVITGVDLDNPELYYVGSETKITEDEGDDDRALLIRPAYIMSPDVCVKTDRTLDLQTFGIVNVAAIQPTFQDRCWKIYSWLLVRRNKGMHKELLEAGIYNTIVGPLIFNEGVCEGYAKAFKFILDKVNAELKPEERGECLVVTGDLLDPNLCFEESGHMWNIVFDPNGRTYHIDVSMEPDADISKEAAEFFLMESSSTILRDRIIDEWR